MNAKPNSIRNKLLVGIFLLTTLFVFFLWLSSLHEVIEEGEAFGFTIGASKEEVISHLIDTSEKSIKTINLVYGDQSSRLATLSSPSEYFNDSDKWVVMYNSAYFFDNVTLEFCEDNLCKLFRKRQFFEMP
ncbi:hypothetical protein J2X32_001291 [Rheinheimera pacifica]|uniref:hypothetical protein n=1 Tax=Rheinheimera pacifica TaxID=173990 RepID=UPI0028593AC7|nr:hypothetical protein [Rheinheimera pacifica]MDR6982673.1 hypothetical protein [Rheinheimera pacifica]